MARPIYIWLPSLTLCALSACSGSDNAFFSDVIGAAGAMSLPPARGGSSSSDPSTAGHANSAGSSNSAGGTNSAGRPGNAGQDQGGNSSGGTHTAGGPSSGGRGGAHSGGSGGSRPGAAGGGAAGGRAGAPSGSGGTGGPDEDLSCTALLKLASDQLEAARACNLTANATQCTGTVTNPCGCEVPVQRNASTETKAYLSTLKQLKDKDCVQVCTKVACTLVNDAQCQSSGSSSNGTCVVNRGPLP